MCFSIYIVFLLLVKEPPLNKGKQMYENWVIDLIQYSRSQIRDQELSWLITTYAEHLRVNVLIFEFQLYSQCDFKDSPIWFICIVDVPHFTVLHQAHSQCYGSD